LSCWRARACARAPARRLGRRGMVGESSSGGCLADAPQPQFWATLQRTSMLLGRRGEAAQTPQHCCKAPAGGRPGPHVRLGSRRVNSWNARNLRSWLDASRSASATVPHSACACPGPGAPHAPASSSRAPASCAARPPARSRARPSQACSSPGAFARGCTAVGREVARGSPPQGPSCSARGRGGERAAGQHTREQRRRASSAERSKRRRMRGLAAPRSRRAPAGATLGSRPRALPPAAQAPAAGPSDGGRAAHPRERIARQQQREQRGPERVQARVRHAARAQHRQQRLRAGGQGAGQQARASLRMRRAGGGALPTLVREGPSGRRAAAARQRGRRRPER